MEESRVWGILGILLALVGLVVIALDSQFLTAIGEGNVGEPIVLYVVGVAVATAVTLAVIAPDVVGAE